MKIYLDFIVAVLMLVTISMVKLNIILNCPPSVVLFLKFGLVLQIIGFLFSIISVWLKFRFNSQKDWEKIVRLQMEEGYSFFEKSTNYVEQIKEKIKKDLYKFYIIIIFDIISLIIIF